MTQQTEIGEIPEEWGVARLGDVCEIRKNKTVDFQKIAFISMDLIPNDGLHAKYVMKSIGEVKSSVYCEVGDILLPKITPCVENEKQAIVPEVPARVARATTEVFPLNCTKMEPLLLFYLLKFSKFRNILINRMIGSTGRQRVPKDAVLSLKIPLPPLPEQRKIASILSTVDEAIQKTDEIIRKTQELKRGLMQELMTRGIGHTKFKRTELGEIPEEWEIKTVSKTCEKPQYGYTQSAKEQPVGPKFLRITDIQDGGVNWDKVPYCKCPDDLIDKYLLKPGDILFARTGATTGKSYIIKKCPKAVFASYLIRIRTKTGVNPDFLFSFFNSQFYWKQVKQNMVGSAQGGMNASLLSKLKVQLPPFTEQQKIASILSAVDEKIEKERQKKEQLEKLKKGLMQDLLTGRVRVKA